LFVTHSIDEAVFVGDRIFLLTDLRTGDYEQFEVDLPAPRAASENRLNPEFIRLREVIYRKMLQRAPH